jgi:dihydroorotase/N-acyl-D-amino-acid deacylase
MLNRSHAVAFSCLVLVSLAGYAALRADTPEFDVIVAGGRIVDGTGAPWFRADLAVKDGRVAAIGDLASRTTAARIEASGLVVSPGFIDLLGQSEMNLLVDPRGASKVLMGVTSEVTGEGSSIAPVSDEQIRQQRETWEHFGLVQDFHTLSEYFARLETRARPAINLGTLVGAGGVRGYVLGSSNTPAAPADLEKMKSLVAQAMEDGALGLSSSLQYVPDRFASTEELIELAKVARRYGGVYFTHQRSESGSIDVSMDEVFRIAREAKIPANIWHFKTAYQANWGRMPAALARLEAARAEGVDVSANVYPYTRASNNLDACLPLWVREGGADALVARLKDPTQRDRIKRDMADPGSPGWENQWFGAGGGDGVMVSEVLNPQLKQYEGMTLSEIGRAMGKDPRDALMDVVIADHANSACIIAIMREDDVRAALAHRLVAIGTDSPARAEDGPLAGTKSHPRGWGSFARVLGKYVRDEKLLTLEEAVRKMTSLPAARAGLRDRGLLGPGMAADVTVFDPATIRDVATFEDPNHYSVGVRFVLVNGEVAVTDGHLASARSGRALRGPGYRQH